MECCICFEERDQVGFAGCQHGCCLACSLNLINCPLCRAKIKWITCPKEKNEDMVSQLANRCFPNSPDLFLALRPLIKGKADVAASLIFQVHQQVQGYLSCTEAEELLIKAQAAGILNCKIQAHIVRLCNEPWLINTELGGSGVCYYGNLGQTPRIGDVINFLNDNKTRTIDL